MASNSQTTGAQDRPWQKFRDGARHAFIEFLKVPVLIIIGFLLLAVATTMLDYSEAESLQSIRATIRKSLFNDSQATADLLATISGSIITVTSITLSLLLLAVQQAASALTHVVYDQFLRRRANQVYFGFFVGVGLYTLVILATVNRPFNPVIGATVALLLTIVALVLVILLLYMTVNQMRPAIVIETIHDHVLIARDRQKSLLERTRSTPARERAECAIAKSTTNGYVTRIDLDALEAAVSEVDGKAEIVLLVSMGHYVACHDPLAAV